MGPCASRPVESVKALHAEILVMIVLSLETFETFVTPPMNGPVIGVTSALSRH